MQIKAHDHHVGELVHMHLSHLAQQATCVPSLEWKFELNPETTVSDSSGSMPNLQPSLVPVARRTSVQERPRGPLNLSTAFVTRGPTLPRGFLFGVLGSVTRSPVDQKIIIYRHG